MRVIYSAGVAIAAILASVPLCGQTETQTFTPAPRKDFLKNLTIESFGDTKVPLADSYGSATPNDSGVYDFPGFNFPPIVVGVPIRTRAFLQPFGAKATYHIWKGRLAFFASSGGFDAVLTDNAPRRNPLLMRATPLNDDWIVTANVGGRIYLDPHRELSMGFTYGYLADPLTQIHGTQFTADVTLTPGIFREIKDGLKRLERGSRRMPNLPRSK